MGKLEYCKKRGPRITAYSRVLAARVWHRDRRGGLGGWYIDSEDEAAIRWKVGGRDAWKTLRACGFERDAKGVWRTGKRTPPDIKDVSYHRLSIPYRVLALLDMLSRLSDDEIIAFG